MAFNIDDMKFHNHPLNRFFQINEKQHTSQNTVKKFINAKRNDIHSTDNDEKQQYPSSHIDTSFESMMADSSIIRPDDIACLQACDICIEDYPPIVYKKKSSDDCGPVCECANSCTRMSIEEIDKIYGHGSSQQTDKGCFLRVYFQMLNN